METINVYRSVCMYRITKPLKHCLSGSFRILDVSVLRAPDTVCTI